MEADSVNLKSKLQLSENRIESLLNDINSLTETNRKLDNKIENLKGEITHKNDEVTFSQ